MYQFTLTEIPKVKMFGYMKQGSVWSHDGAVSEEEILVFPLSGSATFILDETREVTVDTRHVLYLPSGIHRRAQAHTSFEYLFIHFTPFHAVKTEQNRADKPAGEHIINKGCPRIFILDDLGDREMCLDTLTDVSKQYESLYRILENCQHMLPDITPMKKTLLDTQCLLFLCHLCEITENESSDYTEWPVLLRHISNYIRRHYTEPLTLQDVAAHYNVSTTYIARLFRRYAKQTFSSYFLQIKMEYAADMLIGGHMRIGEIAQHLGYANIYYFSAVFHRYFGCSPTEYRNNYGIS